MLSGNKIDNKGEMCCGVKQESFAIFISHVGGNSFRRGLLQK